jgi:hypothetical protein
MSDQRKAAFSQKGCRPIWPSPPTASATSLENQKLADYFFISELFSPSRMKSSSSLQALASCLTGGGAPSR